MTRSLALYIHWPFCVSKCPYCDFNSRPLTAPQDAEDLRQAYLSEIAWYAAQHPARPLSSIYFGGGTPSLMPESLVAELLNAVTKSWPILPDCEITMEANPSSFEIEKFRSFRHAGINRLSLGLQSLRDESLRFLGRPHDVATGLHALDQAMHIFDRVSFDLIYALAGQTPDAWEKELTQALHLGATHMSLYQLTVEDHTVFAKRAKQERLTTDEETSAILYELTQDLTQNQGLPAYEIANHAQPGQESRHNLTYWRYGDYVGIGPGAHGRLCDDKGQRTATQSLRTPKLWRDQVLRLGHGLETQESLTPKEAMTEALLMGLRLTEGLSYARWKELFGTDLYEALPTNAITALTQSGHLESTPTHLRATKQGRECLDTVLIQMST